MWRILKRLGLNRLPASQRYKRHDRRWKRYEKPLPGHRVQIDVKFIQPLPGAPKARKYYQFTAIDDCTRLRVLRIYDRCNQRTAIQFLDYLPERLDELDVDLDPVAGQGLLVALPARVVALGALGGGEPVEVQALEDAPHAGVADLDVVVALEVHRDLERAEVVVLAQVDDLAHDLGPGDARAEVGAAGAVPQPVQAVGLVAAILGVVALAADAVVPAGQGDVAGDLLNVTDDRQAAFHLAGQLRIAHWVSLLDEDPECQRSQSVPYGRSYSNTLEPGQVG